MTSQALFPVDHFLPYMADVGKCERSLQDLSQTWRMIEASAKMNCPADASAILPTMAATREGFAALETELVTSLARQKVDNVLAALSTKAQYVIDIVVRNLYERTADVGFLATDRDLCAFVAGLPGYEDADAVRLRLRAYRSKYTVYDEIMLLDLAGNVLVQIDESTPIEGSHDPLIAATLACDGYVESFGASALHPTVANALVYSRRVHHPDSGAVVGVLCLFFNVEAEMASIFSTHSDGAGSSIMLLLDSDNRVIASADPLWIPIGAAVPVNHAGAPSPLMYAGRQYLVRSFRSSGYQGYAGPPGWQGQVMTPLDVAFRAAGSNLVDQLDAAWADGLLTHARSFCPPLFEIIGAVEMIKRVVWNGQVMTAGHSGDLERLRAILEQISETGARSNALFSGSIKELFGTSLDSGLRDAGFVSHLMVDLLDRNLYERANDCRWWAVSPSLRELVAGDAPTRATQIATILAHINDLYTVYSDLLVYDRDGCVIASSRSGGGAAARVERIESDTLARVLALRHEQQYHVTPFGRSALGGTTPTYVYHAAIRAPHDESIIGGIGIVFDAATELQAMLVGALAGKTNAHGYFTDRSGVILASTDASRPVGSVLQVDGVNLAPAAGVSSTGVATHDGHYAVVGCTASHGYREFKGIDGYREDVIGVVIESFGLLTDSTLAVRKGPDLGSARAAGQMTTEYATFYIGEELFAIDATFVCEALPATRVAPVSMGAPRARAGLLELGTDAQAGAYAWVFDLGQVISGRVTPLGASAQVVVMRHGRRTIGLLASELHSVSKFDRRLVAPMPLAQAQGGMLIGEVIRAGDVLIQVLDAAYLFGMFDDPEQQLLCA